MGHAPMATGLSKVGCFIGDHTMTRLGAPITSKCRRLGGKELDSDKWNAEA
jgi:hypothetical protein